MKIKLLVLIGLGLAIAYTAAGQPRKPDTGDAVFMVDVPVSYGEELFRQRIQTNTAGERPAFGLVLSGGSARAFSHIGVLRYLEEQSLVPDFIVTNSMGSIVGMLYAAGFSPDQIEQVIGHLDISQLFRLAGLGKSGLIDVEAFLGVTKRFIGNPRIENLPIPIMVICEDINSKRQIRIMEGDFLTVMQAAFALPVFFKPVPFRGHLLIDGGVTNLVPLVQAYEYTDLVLASTALYNNPDLDKSNPLTILNIAMDISKSRTGINQLKTYRPILIRTAVESFSFMAFDRLTELVALGYASAQEQFDLADFRLQSGGPVPPADNGQKLGELSILRAAHQQNIIRGIAHLGDGDRVEAHGWSWNLTPTLDFTGFYGDYQYLRGDILGGLKMAVRKNGLYARLSAGALWPDQGPLLQPELSAAASLGWFYGQYFHAAGSGQLFLTPQLSPDRLYANSLVYGRLPVNPKTTLKFNLQFEMTKSLTQASEAGQSSQRSLFSAMAGTELRLGSYRQEFEVSAQLMNLRTLSADAGSRLDWQAVPFLNLSGRVLARYSFMTENPAPRFLRDGIISGGPPSPWFVHGLAVAKFGIPGLTLTFSEMLIFKKLNLGLYGESGYYGQTVWGGGLAAAVNLSLLGLSDFNLVAYYGYSSLGQNYTGRILLRKTL